ncbi:MAG: DUF427 domain-containing protein [Methylobacterium mesophilicum]|nr:DUF427 domain-containing protein [Methylobacterium mesophilicum]
MQTGLNPSPGFKSNPDKRITVEPFSGTVNVSLGDAMLASTKRAMVLREGDYPEVYYIPFEDIYFEHLERTDSRAHCPYKGDATYWRATAVGEAREDAMWAYEAPFDEMESIRDHGAFYPDRVRIEAVSQKTDEI